MHLWQARKIPYFCNATWALAIMGLFVPRKILGLKPGYFFVILFIYLLYFCTNFIVRLITY